MPDSLPLSETQIQSGLLSLPGWTCENNRLCATYRFADFQMTFAAMTAIALQAEKLAHHPEWSNVYHTLTVRLTTHDAGNQVTELDLILARIIHEIATRMGAHPLSS